jgi:hypothetical protein
MPAPLRQGVEWNKSLETGEIDPKGDLTVSNLCGTSFTESIRLDVVASNYTFAWLLPANRMSRNKNRALIEIAAI